MSLSDYTNLILEGDAQLEESCSLWPDPFDSPLSLPSDILARLIEHPEEDPDLLYQVTRTIEGRRCIATLKNLAAAGMGIPPRHSLLTPISKTARLECSVAKAPNFGEIWVTTRYAEIFDGQRIRTARTWRPALAIITAEPQRLEHDTICRAIYCSSAAALCETELLSSTPCLRLLADTEEEYVAHLELEYPVSCFQLSQKLAALLPGEAIVLQEAVAAFLQGEPHPRLSSRRSLSQSGEKAFRRLLAGAEWLCASAIARLQATENVLESTLPEEASLEESRIITIPGWSARQESRLLKIEENLALSASGRSLRTPVVLTSSPLELFSAQFLQISEGCSYADLLEFPTIEDADSDSATGQWRLPDSHLGHGTEEFLLAHRKTGEIIGGGDILNERFLELRHAAGTLERTDPSDFLLLILTSND
ncbi:MAG: hypothetical protein ACAI35_21545 [Candidatus Methylacidiphilales bacterium]